MIIKQKKKRKFLIILKLFIALKKTKRPYIDGEDLPDEMNKKVNRKSLLFAILTFFVVLLGGSYLVNLFLEVMSLDITLDFTSEVSQASFIWFRWYWLFRFPTWEFFLMTLFTALILSFVTYRRIGRRIESLNYGQKGDHRFATLKEIKAQYVEIPDKKETFAGIGGVPISHHGNKYYLDLDTVNSLFLGTSRSGKGEGHVIPLIDILSRAMTKCAMVVNDAKGELFAAAKEILEERGYEVQVLNIIDPMQSMSYNPLQLIVESWRNGDRPTAQKLVSTFAHAVFYEAGAGQNKWVYEGAEKLFSAVVLAMIDECGKNNTLEKVTIYNVGQMIIELSAKKFVNPTTGEEKDGLDKYFEKLPRGNVAKARYASALSAGKKTKGSILSIVFDKLDIFQSESIAKMTSANSFDLKSVGFPGSIMFKFEPKLFNKRFKVNFIRDGQILDSSTIRPNLTGVVNLNFNVDIKTGDTLEVTTLNKSLGKKIIYKIERIANHALKELSYSKIVKLHQEIDTLGVLKQIDMTYSDKPIAVFMITPDYDTSQNVIASTFVKQLYTTLAQNASITKGKKCFRRVQFILDEAGNMPAIEGLDNMLTVCLGRNIIFNLFLQSYSQLDALYNKDIAKIVKENCQNHIYIASGDPDTHEEISKRVSTKTVESISISEKVLDMETSQTRQAAEERVISTGRISTILEGETIVLRPLKRRDLQGNKIRPFPIFNTKETAMPYRYQFLADDFDTNKDINDFDISSKHTHLCLLENAVDVDMWLTDDTPTKSITQKSSQKVTEKSVRKWLKEETTLTSKQIEQIMKYQKTA